MLGRHSLRKTLIITLVVTALAPMLLAGISAYFYLSDNTTSTIKTSNEMLAGAFAEDVLASLKEPQIILKQVAFFLLAHGPDNLEMNETLDITVRGTEFFESIYMVDKSGKVLHVGLSPELVSNRRDFVGLDLSSSNFFKHLLNAPKYPAWSDTFLSLLSGRFSLTLCIPAGENFLIGNFSIEHLHKLTSYHSLGKQLIVSIYDRHGTLIFHPDHFLVEQKLNLSHILPVKEGLSGNEGTYRYNLNGVEYLGSVAGIRDTGWLVCVSQPYVEAYSPISRLRGYFLAIGACSVILAVIVAIYIGRRFSGPITNLEESAKAIAAGDYGHPLPELKYTELEELAGDFREMAAAIRKRQQLLSESYSRVQNQLRFQQAMMDTITMPIFYIDKNGSCLGCNRAFEEATGREREEWLGKNIVAESGFGIADCFMTLDDYGCHDSDNCPTPDTCSCGSDGLRTSECTVRYADGVSHHIIYYSKPFLNDRGEQGGLVCVCLDISERKKTEKALQQSEERLKLAMEATELGIWTLNIQTGEGYVDQRWAAMLEYDLDEIVPNMANWQRLIHPADRQRVDEALSDHLQGRKDYYECEVRLLTKSGSWKWILDRGKITEWDKNDKPLRMAGTHKDITDIKRMEEDLRQAQKMEAIGTLAGGIAHDFNNMLNAIIGYTELALLDLPEKGQVSENLSEVLIAAKRAAVLVKQILTFSRQTEHEKQVVYLQPVLKEIIKLLRGTLPTTVDIKAVIKPDCSPILADITQVHQIVMNLATNANHAMQEKGGLLEISLNEEELDEKQHAEMPELAIGRYVVLRVRDTGSGMEQSVKERMFDPYFTTKGLGEGTGLGLSTVHGIIRSHSGGIRVTSEPGQGSVFEVYFPAQNKDAVSIEEENFNIDGITRLKGHIMFVDDEPSLVTFGRKILEKFGCRVTSFTQSREALEAFSNAPDDFDLIITDQTMPQLTGLDMTKEILRLRPEMPVILATGYSESVDEELATASGVSVFLMKPLSVEMLAKSVKELLSSDNG